MRLHPAQCLLFIQFYFHIAHEAFLSLIHFIFYCCTPVNPLKPSHSIICGMRMRNLSKPPCSTARCFEPYNVQPPHSRLCSSRGIQCPPPPLPSPIQTVTTQISNLDIKCYLDCLGYAFFLSIATNATVFNTTVTPDKGSLPSPE